MSAPNQQKQQSGSASVTPFAVAKAAPAATGCCSGRYVATCA
jgi:hypothetical protein